jgi:hypothetical protein
MHSFLDAKAMAKALRQTLVARNIELSHSDCLEVVARQFGLSDWNTLAARIAAASPEARQLTLPEGWFVTGPTELRNYRLGLDPSASGTALIESRLDRASGIDLAEKYAVLMQSIVADAFRGGKVKLTAGIRTEDADLGTLWMRVDRAPGSALHFDNMVTRRLNGPLKGTADWTERSIVLEVPDEATSIHYGFFLQGYGRIQARAFRLEIVSQDSETTGGADVYLPKPTNLDFSLAA